MCLFAPVSVPEEKNKKIFQIRVDTARLNVIVLSFTISGEEKFAVCLYFPGLLCRVANGMTRGGRVSPFCFFAASEP
jgi:hypothetical protein